MLSFRITLILVLAIILTVVPGSSSYCVASASKLLETEMYLESIQAARNYHLADDEFMHDFRSKITRQELAMLMIKMLGKLAYKNIDDLARAIQSLYMYNDKPAPSKVYIPYILMASKLEIVSSVTKNKFSPYGLVTREFFALALLKALIYARPMNNYNINYDVKFADDKKIKIFPRTGLIYAYKKKYLTTNSLNEIKPRSYVTREQAVDIIYKVLTDEKAILKLSEEEIKRAKGILPLFKMKSSNMKWGYKDNNAKTIILPQYDDAREFHEGLAAVSMGGKWGFIDTAANFIAKPIYEKVHDYYEGYSAVSSGGKYGYIDRTGKIVIKLQYLADNEFQSNNIDFLNGRATVKISDNKYRIINTAGKSLKTVSAIDKK